MKWLVIVLALGGCGDEKAPEPEPPVDTRIDALGIEIGLASSWKREPAASDPKEVGFYRGASSAAPDAKLLLVETDMDLSDADDEHLLVRTNDVGKRTAGNCEVRRDGNRRFGRCVGKSGSLASVVYVVPEAQHTITLLLLSTQPSAQALAEAEALFGSLRVP